MKVMPAIRVVALVALALASRGANWPTTLDHLARAQPSASITISLPSKPIVGEGDDFATTVLGDPWDMNEPSDVMLWNDLPNATINAGVLSYSTTANGTADLPLLLPAGSDIDAGKIGARYPIDTSRYRWLSFRLKQPGGGSNRIQIRWHYAKTFTPYGSKDIYVATNDWHTYVVDLSSLWSGQVLGLYLVSWAPSGSQVSIDWARLTTSNPSSNKMDVSWTGLSPSGPGNTVRFYLDPDAVGCDGTLIRTVSNAPASSSFSWWQASSNPDDIAAPANVAPGAYYVCATVNGSYAGRSSGQLTINQAPIVKFTRPSYVGGDDYATNAGNPWDMSDAADVRKIENGSGSFVGGNLVVTVPSDKSDVQVHPRLPNDVPIDSSRYYYLTYKLWVDHPYSFYQDEGQFTRIFWGQTYIETTSRNLYVFPGWQTYSLDLRSASLVSGPAWSTDHWGAFRIDPIANGTSPRQSVTFYIDEIKLTGDERADSFATVQWEMADPDTAVTTMTLYYDADRSGLNGTLIATLKLTDGRPSTLALPTQADGDTLQATRTLSPALFLPLVARNYCSGACYTWHTSAVAPGAYYLYACVNDGYNQICRYSETPVIISHP